MSADDQFKRSRDEQLSYVILAIASTLCYFLIIPAQIAESDLATVSPRLIPELCMVLVFALSIYKLLASFRFGIYPALVTPRNYAFLIMALGILAIATILIPIIGFWWCAFGLIGALSILAGLRSPWKIVLYAGGLTLTSWFLLNQAGLYISP